MNTTILVTLPCDVIYIKSLWNGSSNDSPPTDWADPNFDDRTWDIASPLSDSAPDLNPPADYLWMPALLHNGEAAMMRHYFSLPDGVVTSAAIRIVVDDILQVISLNNNTFGPSGVSFGGTPEPIDITVPTADFIPGQTNVLSVWAQNDSLDDRGGINYVLTITQDDPVSPFDSGDPVGQAPRGGELGTSGDPTSAVRLRHASGVVDWEHDGKTFRVLTNNRTVLQTPFPTMVEQPTALLGKDPKTGMPMWVGQIESAPAVPAPPPVSTTYSTPDDTLDGTVSAPIPLPVPADAERVCGAAAQMATLLCLIYDAMVQVVNKAKDNIIDAFTSNLKADIAAELTSLLTEAEFGQFEIDAAQLALTILKEIVSWLLAQGTALPQVLLPSPAYPDGQQQYQFARCAAWQALWLTSGNYFSENKSANGKGTRDYWISALAPQWSFFAGSTISGISETNPPWQLIWFNQIISHVPDVAWAKAAAIGAHAPSTHCVGCTGYPEG